MEDKKIIFSGVQQSGNLTLGNYLGAIKNWVDIQKDYNCIYSMMDLHTITVRQTPADIRRRTLEVLALYIACGINPEETILFIQSHNPAHAELGWVLNLRISLHVMPKTSMRDCLHILYLWRLIFCFTKQTMCL